MFGLIKQQYLDKTNGNVHVICFLIQTNTFYSYRISFNLPSETSMLYMFAPAVYLYGIPASMIIIAVSSSVKHFNLVHI